MKDYEKWREWREYCDRDDDDAETEAWGEAEFERHWTGECGCRAITDEVKAAVRVTFEARLIVDPDETPSNAEVRDALRYLEYWAYYHTETEIDLPGNEPMPPDFQAHIDEVIPGVRLTTPFLMPRGEEREMTWHEAAAMIGTNTSTMTYYMLRDEKYGPVFQKLIDGHLFVIGYAEHSLSEIEPDSGARSMLENVVEEAKAMVELISGKPPQLLDPALFALDTDDEEDDDADN